MVTSVNILKAKILLSKLFLCKVDAITGSRGLLAIKTVSCSPEFTELTIRISLIVDESGNPQDRSCNSLNISHLPVSDDLIAVGDCL